MLLPSQGQRGRRNGGRLRKTAEAVLHPCNRGGCEANAALLDVRGGCRGKQQWPCSVPAMDVDASPLPL